MYETERYIVGVTYTAEDTVQQTLLSSHPTIEEARKAVAADINARVEEARKNPAPEPKGKYDENPNEIEYGDCYFCRGSESYRYAIHDLGLMSDPDRITDVLNPGQ